MSYGPQPPTRTPYGDQDFVKEDYSPPSRVQPHFPDRSFGGPPSNASYGLQPPRLQSPELDMPATHNNDPARSDVQDLTNKIQTLTPEDRIFLKSWRQDSFYYRVLPISASFCGALYYYNHIKNRPQSVGRYLLVLSAGYFVGKWSYKGELLRRLEMTPLNTPFIKTLRQMTGVKPAISSMDEFSGDTSQDLSSAWNYVEPTQLQPTASFSQIPHTAYGQYNQDATYNPELSTSGEPQKTFTSYEELRAKNRGLLQK